MENFVYLDKEYHIDSEGFLVNPDEWDRNFAEGMAPNLKIGSLTEDHWTIIDYIRSTYERMNLCPIIYDTCRKCNLNLTELMRLFPTGYQRGACLLSGVTYNSGYLGYHYMDKVYQRQPSKDKMRTYTVDSHGFLIDPTEWNETYAVLKAEEMKMPALLTDRHWDVIYYLRDKFQKTERIPSVYDTCRDNNLDLDDLEKLFPDGYHRGAVKLAGLRLNSAIPGK